jgi:hypothetical protein
VSNLDRIRATTSGGTAAGGATPSGTAPRLPTIRPPAPGPAPSVPSAEGTAVLNLSSEQAASIRKLLIGLRYGRNLADDVRSQIFGLLNRGQRRLLGAAWFILSVKV